MTEIKMLHKADVFTSGRNRKPCYRIPVLVPGGAAVVCERRVAGYEDNGGEISIIWRELYSGVENTIVGKPTKVVANPQILYAPNLPAMLWYTESAPGESEEQMIETGSRRRVWLNFDDVTDMVYGDMCHVNPTAGNMLRMSTGRIIAAFSGTTEPYIGTSEQTYWEKVHAAPWHCFILYSDDDGKTWQRGLVGPPGTNEVAMCEMHKGEIYFNARCLHKYGRRWSGVSKDGGKTADWWYHDDLTTASSHASVVFDYATGALYFACPKGPRRKKLVLHKSVDAGKTWEAIHTIHKGYACYSGMEFVGEELWCVFERDSYAGISLAILGGVK